MSLGWWGKWLEEGMHAWEFCSAGDSPILDFLLVLMCVWCAKVTAVHDLCILLYVNYTIKVY